jgi:hypothetical protein
MRAANCPPSGRRHLRLTRETRRWKWRLETNLWHSRPLARATALALAASPVRARRRRQTCGQNNALVLGRHCVQGTVSCSVVAEHSTQREQALARADGQGGSAEMTCVSPELLGSDSKVLEQGVFVYFVFAVVLGEGGSPKIVCSGWLAGRDIAAATVIHVHVHVHAHVTCTCKVLVGAQ